MLSTLKIGPRINLGFSVLLCLLVSIGGVSSYGLWSANDALSKYRSFVETGDLAADLESASLNLRLTTRDFRMTGNAQLKTQFDESAAAARQLIDRAVAMPISAQQREKFAQVKEALDGYAASFARLVELFRDKDTIQTERLTGLGPKIDEQVGKLLAEARARGDLQLALKTAETLRALMYGRVLVQSHEVKRDAATAGKVKQQMELFAAELAEIRPSYQSPAALAALKEIDVLFAKYVDAFDDKLKVMAAIGEVVTGPMQVQASAVKALASDIRRDLRQAEVALGDTTAAGDGVALTISLIVMVLAIGLGIAAALLIGRSIRNPITGMTATMRTLATGDKTVAVPGVGRKDEIGEMAAAVQVFKDSMLKADALAAEQQAEQQRKEGRQKIVDGYIKEFDRSVSASIGVLASASTEMQTTAQSMSKTAEETRRQSTTVAAASEQASTNVQTVASAAEELSSSISEIGRQVAESARIAGQAKDQADRTNAQIKSLAEAAQRIGDVVKLITDIAGQTNLLALNATIEAARAGDAGKGFAVVASEVKSLANQTAKATEEIGAKIAEMQAATGDSVQAVQTIADTIGRINEIATTIASAVEEQGAATQEIARNVQQASAGTAEVSSTISSVTTAAAETGAASAQVLGAAGELAKQSETLRHQVDGFIAKVRAA